MVSRVLVLSMLVACADHCGAHRPLTLEKSALSMPALVPSNRAPSTPCVPLGEAELMAIPRLWMTTGEERGRPEPLAGCRLANGDRYVIAEVGVYEEAVAALRADPIARQAACADESTSDDDRAALGCDFEERHEDEEEPPPPCPRPTHVVAILGSGEGVVARHDFDVDSCPDPYNITSVGEPSRGVEVRELRFEDVDDDQRPELFVTVAYTTSIAPAMGPSDNVEQFVLTERLEWQLPHHVLVSFNEAAYVEERELTLVDHDHDGHRDLVFRARSYVDCVVDEAAPPLDVDVSQDENRRAELPEGTARDAFEWYRYDAATDRYASDQPTGAPPMFRRCVRR